MSIAPSAAAASSSSPCLSSLKLRRLAGPAGIALSDERNQPGEGTDVVTAILQQASSRETIGAVLSATVSTKANVFGLTDVNSILGESLKLRNELQLGVNTASVSQDCISNVVKLLRKAMPNASVDHNILADHCQGLLHYVITSKDLFVKLQMWLSTPRCSVRVWSQVQTCVFLPTHSIRRTAR
jgi:hypothetical protein